MYHLDNPNIRKAALVIVGNEILTGRTQDTNTQWIAEYLLRYGIALMEVRVVPDIEERIVQAVRDMSGVYEYVLTTGGIGPTHDDITADSVAKAFGVEIEQNQDAYDILLNYYGEEELTPARLRMARIPVGASLIPNAVSGAPGFVLENVHVMAGVPRIMQSMLTYLVDNVLKHGHIIRSNTIACNLQESQLSEALGKLQKKYPAIDIGSYPHYRGGRAGLNLVLRTTDKEKLKAATEDLVVLVRDHGDEPRAMGLQVLIDNF